MAVSAHRRAAVGQTAFAQTNLKGKHTSETISGNQGVRPPGGGPKTPPPSEEENFPAPHRKCHWSPPPFFLRPVHEQKGKNIDSFLGHHVGRKLET